MACTILLPSAECIFSFVNGKVIIDVTYLKGKVLPLSFSAFHAILQIGSEELRIPLERISNHLAEQFYILDMPLSSEYVVVVKD